MKNILIIFGGKSSKYEVSLESSFGILSNIDREIFNPIPVAITKNGEWFVYFGDIKNIKDGSFIIDRDNKYPCALLPGRILSIFRPQDEGGVKNILIDAAFPAVHGANCEDGRLQGYFDIISLPYVGAGTLSSALCMDKDLTKLVVANKGMPVAPWITITTTNDEFGTFMVNEYNTRTEILKDIEKFGYPLFVKPARAGSSVGVSKVRNESELKSAIKTALLADDSNNDANKDNFHYAKAIIEKMVMGVEVEVGVMCNKGEETVVSRPAQIVAGAEFYDYNAKYHNENSHYFIPAKISPSATKTVMEYAKNIFKYTECTGLARVDFFVDSEDIVFNEINTLPGFTPISMYPKLMQDAGISYKELITRLINGVL